MNSATLINTILYYPANSYFENFVFASHTGGQSPILNNVHIFTDVPNITSPWSPGGRPNGIFENSPIAMGAGYHIRGLNVTIAASAVNPELFDLSMWNLTGARASFN